MAKYFFTSLTRISDLRETEFVVAPLPREQWRAGDYVVGEVIERPSALSRVELSTGRTTEVMEGSSIIGALARREATLESNGDWRLIGEDMRMEALGAGGSMGKLTSKSPYLPAPIALIYRGHVLIEGEKVNMRDYVPDIAHRRFDLPVILVVGTSMSAGKTTVARIVIRELKEMGLTVIGSKFAGAGRYRDILSMRDAGADAIYDFVDVGLPTTVCEPELYRQAVSELLSILMEQNADVVVAEVGASPLEPYNGIYAVEAVRDNICFTILCASDPYAVVGLIQAYESLQPDLVAGAAANTLSAIKLVKRLSNLKALNLLDRESSWELRELLSDRLNIPDRAKVAAGGYHGTGDEHARQRSPRLARRDEHPG